MFKSKIKISELAFYLTGLMILVALPILEGDLGATLWFSSKLVYFIGLILFGLSFRK